MHDKNKTMPKAMRLTEETSEKFRIIAQDLGANQEQAMAKLIEVYEIELGRSAIPEARENIDTFEGYMRAAINMYMQSLENNQNMRALVRTEFESQLKTKDGIIEELHTRAKDAEQRAKAASDKEYSYISEIKALKDELETKENELQTAKAESAKNFADLEVVYRTFESTSERLRESEEKAKLTIAEHVAENNKLKEENDSLRNTNRELDVTIFNMGRENVELETKLEQAQQSLREERASRADEVGQYRKTVELEHKLALTELENALTTQYMSEIEGLRKELDKYKDLYYQQNK